MHEHLTDEQLLALTPREPAAFDAFYLRHERLVLAWARRRTPSAEVAIDVAAELLAHLPAHEADAVRARDRGAELPGTVRAAALLADPGSGGRGDADPDLDAAGNGHDGRRARLGRERLRRLPPPAEGRSRPAGLGCGPFDPARAHTKPVWSKTFYRPAPLYALLIPTASRPSTCIASPGRS